MPTVTVSVSVWNKIERVDGDVSILEEHRADLLEELREVVCGEE
ncbi:MAG: hypothetical protein J07HQW1_01703 [Haloquadratum walsbyi J07HQW1]|uniref:Uncharacterized protein n=1 Tax=Haloquadratum walsbyi J07HQW1 TaxID=1238424 RepID=U1MP36_9EURY|nr:MAG: hypothetical protein J07HQW1_01703 [Haloquadratum walsbyi J07HQW1]